MSMTVSGHIQVDVSDYSDDLDFVADCHDILEVMEQNQITSSEMIEFLKEEGTYALDYEQVTDWLEQQPLTIVATLMRHCVTLMFNEFRDAEDGRLYEKNRVAELEAQQAESLKVLSRT